MDRVPLLGTNNSTLELLSAASPLLGNVLLKTLLVLSPVEHSPADLPGVPLQHVRLMGAGGQELVALTISLDQGATMAWVDLVAGEDTQVNLHPDPRDSEKQPNLMTP